MTPIGIVVRPENERAVALAADLLSWCKSRKIPTVLETHAAEALSASVVGVPPVELVQQSDLIVTLGGDGTLIGVARYVHGKSPVMLGVNFGNLGFLTEIAPSELFSTLEKALAGKVECGERVLMEARIIRDGEMVFTSQAVNEVVVQKGARSKLLDFDFAVDGEDVARIRADGLILATPTGSTAYSLAAGGSIAHPSLSVFLVTPICPHSLTNRPLILPATSRLTVEVPQVDGEVLVNIDGQLSEILQGGDTVEVVQAKQTVRFVRSAEKDYFDILRTKLNWGAPNRSE